MCGWLAVLKAGLFRHTQGTRGPCAIILSPGILLAFNETWHPTQLYSSCWADFSWHLLACASSSLGDFPSKESIPDSCKRNGKQGKWKRQRPLESSESNSYVKDGGSSSKQQATVNQSPWGPGEGPRPAPSGMAFPPHPYSVPRFPLAPLGGDLTLPSVVAAPVLPSSLPYCIQPTSAFPAPGRSMIMWLHTFPVCPLPPQSFFPAQQPCSSTSYPCTMIPGPPSTVPTPTAPDPVEPASLPSTLLSEDEHQEVSDVQAPLFSSSRSSSPLQLNLLQEELPSNTQAETSTEIKRVSPQIHVGQSQG